MPHKSAPHSRYVGTKHSLNMSDKRRNAAIDAALADMLAQRRPGQIFTCPQIAKATGMSTGGVSYIVRHALLKLRRIPNVRQLLAEVSA